jgi:His/Glu/Gln/Arg/opine family amino acid ABC transporter permease subunit
MLMDAATLLDYLPVLLAGAVITLELTLFTLIGGLIIALPIAFARNAERPGPRWFAQSFVFFFRGAPLLVVLYLVYYGLPQIPGIKESPVWFLIAGRCRSPSWRCPSTRRGS